MQKQLVGNHFESCFGTDLSA
jgi:hypothetical protein